MTTKQTNIRLPAEIRDWYDAIAAADDREPVFFMKKALIEYMERVKGEVAPVAKLPAVVKAPVKSASKEKFNAADFHSPLLNMAAWLEWVEYRKAKGKPVSKLAAEKQTKELIACDLTTQALMIDQSIKNDYTGIFPLKGGGGHARPPVDQSGFLNSGQQGFIEGVLADE